MAVSILIADDHGLLRAGLRSLLNAGPDLEVIGEAADGDAALSLAEQLRPDVVLADISMPGPNGIQVARRLKRTAPDTRVLIVSMHEDRGLMREAVLAGATGYIPKRAVEAELIKAIRTVANGGTYLQGGLEAPGDSAPPASQREPMTIVLGPEETELLRLVARGYANAQVAEALGTNLETAERKRAGLMNRLGLRGRVDAVRYARDHGII